MTPKEQAIAQATISAVRSLLAYIDKLVERAEIANKLIERAETAEAERERLQVQLAGCSVAALGGSGDPAKPEDYGWSIPYQETLDLRARYEAAKKELGELKQMTTISRVRVAAWYVSNARHMNKRDNGILPGAVPDYLIDLTIDLRNVDVLHGDLLYPDGSPVPQLALIEEPLITERLDAGFVLNGSRDLYNVRLPYVTGYVSIELRKSDAYTAEGDKVIAQIAEDMAQPKVYGAFKKVPSTPAEEAANAAKPKADGVVQQGPGTMTAEEIRAAKAARESRPVARDGFWNHGLPPLDRKQGT